MKLKQDKITYATFNEIEKMCVFNHMEQWREGASCLCEDMTECATHHILYWKIPDSKYKKCPLCSIAEKFGVKKMKLSKKEYEDMLLDNGYEKNHIKTISDFMYS